MSVSIITPWLNASELIPIYELSTIGAQIVIVDNGSDWNHARNLEQLCTRLDGIYIRNNHNALFATANNQGLAQATGDVILFMNNDVQCRDGFVEKVEADVQPGALYGPSLLEKHGWQYLEGWCIAARREVWNALEGWDDKYYGGLYWEDNDLCARAVQLGYKLVQTYWPVWHYNNYTSSKIAGAYDKSAENERKFVERVTAWK